MSHNSMIINELQDCEKPDSLGVSASVFSVQLGLLITELGISDETMRTLVRQYISLFSSILDTDEQKQVHRFVGDNMRTFLKALAKGESDQTLQIATNCIFNFTDTPYNPADALMVTAGVASFMADAMTCNPRSNGSWGVKSVSNRSAFPSQQNNTTVSYGSDASNKPSKNYDKTIFAVIIAAVLLLVGILIWFDSGSGPEAKASVPSAPTSTPFDRIKQPISNGQKISQPAFECDCPLTVSVPDDGNDYYVYFKYVGEPQNSVTSREPLIDGVSRGNNLSFYIASGKTVETEIPVGVYKLYYAAGEDWYGAEHKFGPSTVYSSSDDPLSFYTEYDGDYIVYNGQTIELWLQTGGNMSTHTIDPTDFP